MTFRRFLALLVIASSASWISTQGRAEFIWNPETDPVDLVCEPDWTPEECEWNKRYEAWSRKHGDDYDLWHHWLLYTPDVYFPKPRRKVPEIPQLAEDEFIAADTLLATNTPNLVDAVYTIALRRYDGWAFAIDDNAVLRMVRKKAKDEIDDDALRARSSFFPDTIEEVAIGIELEWGFYESDLTSCRGAIAHLREFPAQRGDAFWSDRSLPWHPRFKPRDDSDLIVVTADGDGVFVRASSREDELNPRRIIGTASIVYDQSNGGAGYVWAKRMAEIVEPCLTPSGAMPPWEYLLQSNDEGETLPSPEAKTD